MRKQSPPARRFPPQRRSQSVRVECQQHKVALRGDANGVRVTQIVESAAPLRMTYDPNNPAANKEGYVQMPNVNVVEEMVNMISASRSYQTNAEMMNTAKQLMLKTLTIGQ